MWGLGMYLPEPGVDASRVVRWAFEAGYRLIDTAEFYGTEDAAGKAVRESGIPREEIFVTTKLWNNHHGYDKGHPRVRGQPSAHETRLCGSVPHPLAGA